MQQRRYCSSLFTQGFEMNAHLRIALYVALFATAGISESDIQAYADGRFSAER
jgi:hypothetical protein